MNREIRIMLDPVVHNFVNDNTRELKYRIKGNRELMDRFTRKKFILTYLGKISASNTTVLIPSRASVQAAYEPAGPPPITSTEVFWGIAMVSCFME